MSAEAVKEYLGWLDELEKRNYADLNSVIRANQWRDAFSEPRPSNIWGEINPNTYLASVKSRLGSYRSEIQSQNDSAKHKMEELEAQILTLQYSKDSVRLTKWNILFSILVPIIILLVSVLIESLKPELITGIRVFLHLPSLKP